MTRWTHLPGEKPKRKVRRLEDNLQCVVVYCLKKEFPNLLFIHPANEGKRTPRQGAKAKAMGVLAGTPDLLLWWGEHQHYANWIMAKAGAIELKSAIGRLTPEQKAWRDRFVALGGKWALCRSYDEVKTALRSWGVSNS